MDHPNPFAGHDSDANPDRLKALRKGQKRFLRQIVALEREKSKLEASLIRAYHGLNAMTIELGALTHPSRSGRGIELAEKSVRAEAAQRLRVSDRAIAVRMNRASAISESPKMLRSLSRGRISLGHVMAILDSSHLVTNAEAKEVFEQQIIDYAEHHSVARTKKTAKRLAEQLADAPLEQRNEEAVRNRTVWVNERDHGMAEVCIYTTAPVAYAIADRLHALAAKVQEHGAPRDEDTQEVITAVTRRTRGNLSADIATELLLTGTPDPEGTGDGALSGVTGTIQLIVPALTLLPAEVRERLRQIPELREIAGVTTQSALGGYGPISDEIARLFAFDEPGWDETVIHPRHGRVLTVNRYRPSAAQERFIRTRDQHCRFTGCVTAVKHTQIDHTHEAAGGGATSTDNLEALCLLHHTLKHHQIHDHYRWHATQEEHGVLTWRSPFGTQTQDEPVTTLMFQPAPIITTIRAGDRRDSDDDSSTNEPPW